MTIGVIGAGAWGKNIVRTLHELEALGAVVDPSPTTRESFAELAPTFDNPDAVLANPNIQAVAIATPGHTHFQLVKEAILAGKDVFVEKPMVLSSREGQELVDLADQHDRILMVGHLLMYQPAISYIRDRVQEGLIGDLKGLHQERLNLGRARQFENVLWSLGVHDIAVLLDVIGNSPMTASMSGQAVLQSQIEDDVYIHLAFEGGVRAHLHCSWLWPTLRRCLTVVGSKGMLVYDEVAQIVTLHRKSIDANLANVNNGEEVVFEAAGKPLTIEMEHFIHCCQTRQTPRSSGRSAVEVLKVIEQCEEKPMQACVASPVA